MHLPRRSERETQLERIAVFSSLTENLNQTGLGYGKLLHGEAVAIGMHMAADMSCRMGWVDQELVDRSVALMKKAGLPVELPAGGGMDMDKFLTVSVDVRVLCTGYGFSPFRTRSQCNPKACFAHAVFPQASSESRRCQVSSTDSRFRRSSLHMHVAGKCCLFACHALRNRVLENEAAKCRAVFCCWFLFSQMLIWVLFLKQRNPMYAYL